jgi:hypothetical protein
MGGKYGKAGQVCSVITFQIYLTVPSSFINNICGFLRYKLFDNELCIAIKAMRFFPPNVVEMEHKN